jgi:hypothetical protein
MVALSKTWKVWSVASGDIPEATEIMLPVVMFHTKEKQPCLDFF